MSKKFSVPLRKTGLTEFEVQAWLYSKLLAMGLDVRGEVVWKDPKTREHCRFDIVIYEGGAAVEILEIKSDVIKHRKGLEETRQGKRYRDFGVPVTFVYGIEDAGQYVVQRQAAA